MSRFLASGTARRTTARSRAAVLRRLTSAGCTPEPLRLIESHLSERSSPEAMLARLSEIATFAKAIGRSAAKDYFRAIGATREVARLTSAPVLEFARSIDPHTAEWYFWTVWGTRAVAELTDERFLGEVEFFRSLDSAATVEYFLAIRETRAARTLTDARVLATARSLGSDAAREFFGACWETRAVAELTGAPVLDFARELGATAAQEYFRAIRATKAVGVLTQTATLKAVRSLGARLAEELFRAVHATGAASQLTREGVLLFLELVGPGPARAYLRVLARTRAVGALTDESLLRGSAVLRAIGAEASLDYFLAAAARPQGTVTELDAEDRVAGRKGPALPVLTLVDVPRYSKYRPIGMAGLTACFWGLLRPWALLSPSGWPLGMDIAAAVGVWLGLLGGAYLLLGAVADRSTEQFLQRRRRLLNEHGIRWHDCAAADGRCALCWDANATHEDGRFDAPMYCRCPAC